jgi:hypothetical protein
MPMQVVQKEEAAKAEEAKAPEAAE